MKPDGTFVYEPPTYAQQLNRAIHRAERAEAALRRYGQHIDRCHEHPLPGRGCHCGLSQAIAEVQP